MTGKQKKVTKSELQEAYQLCQQKDEEIKQLQIRVHELEKKLHETAATHSHEIRALEQKLHEITSSHNHEIYKLISQTSQNSKTLEKLIKHLTEENESSHQCKNNSNQVVYIMGHTQHLPQLPSILNSNFPEKRSFKLESIKRFDDLKEDSILIFVQFIATNRVAEPVEAIDVCKKSLYLFFEY